MSIAAWEKVGIVILVGVVALVRDRLPVKLELGDVVLLSAVLLLSQGLVRDLAGLVVARARAKGAPARVTCVCAESTFGVGLIIIGVLFLFCTSPVVLRVPALGWPAGVGGVALFGFATRHLVFDWSARRLRWEPDHLGVVVWKSASK